MYQTAAIPGKGIGLIATRDINKGEVVLTERCLFKAGETNENSTLQDDIVAASGVELEKDLISAVEQILSGGNKYDVLKLCGDSKTEIFLEWLTDAKEAIVEKGHSFEDFCKALAVIQENSFTNSNNEEEVSPVLFTTASRINHSCLSSANLEPHVWSDEITLQARHTIAKGEELTIDYLNQENEDIPPPQRSSEIESRRGFTCQCATCCEDLPYYPELDRKITLLLSLGSPEEALIALTSSTPPLPSKHYLRVKLYRALRDYAELTGEYSRAVEYAEEELKALSCPSLSMPRALLMQAINIKRVVKKVPRPAEYSEYPLISEEPHQLPNGWNEATATEKFNEAIRLRNMLLPKDRGCALDNLVEVMNGI